MAANAVTAAGDPVGGLDGGELAIAEGKGRELDGLEKAALLLLSLGDNAAPIWQNLTEEEIRDITLTMVRLGKVTSEMVNNIFVEFVGHMSSNAVFNGNMANTEQLLKTVMSDEKVAALMEEIKGPAGRNMWEKLSAVPEQVLTNYLKNEYPQTVAVILSKIDVEHASRVLALLPDDFSLEVVHRMLRMESVQKDVIEKVEDTLRSEFMSNISAGQRRDAHEQMAEIFNSFDRQTETRFMTNLETSAKDAAEKIKSLMFTFDDLTKLDPSALQTLLQGIEKDQLGLALKGANEEARGIFFSNMSQRAAKLLQDDMEAMGPVRLKDVDDAQTLLVNTAKDLAAKGDIIISKSKGEDELVF
ncbi:MAG: flagellar motor switch protein FliG [Pseudomonadota bacterium]